MGIESSALMAVIALIIGLAASAVGGVLGGIFTGGKHIGYGIASMMGGFYGVIGGGAGVVLGLAVLLLIGGLV